MSPGLEGGESHATSKTAKREVGKSSYFSMRKSFQTGVMVRIHRFSQKGQDLEIVLKFYRGLNRSSPLFYWGIQFLLCFLIFFLVFFYKMLKASYICVLSSHFNPPFHVKHFQNEDCFIKVLTWHKNISIFNKNYFT